MKNSNAVGNKMWVYVALVLMSLFVTSASAAYVQQSETAGSARELKFDIQAAEQAVKSSNVELLNQIIESEREFVSSMKSYANSLTESLKGHESLIGRCNVLKNIPGMSKGSQPVINNCLAVLSRDEEKLAHFAKTIESYKSYLKRFRDVAEGARLSKEILDELAAQEDRVNHTQAQLNKTSKYHQFLKDQML